MALPKYLTFTLFFSHLFQCSIIFWCYGSRILHVLYRAPCYAENADGFQAGGYTCFCVICKTCIQENRWEPEQKIDEVITKTKFNANTMAIPLILSCVFLSYLTQNKEFTNVTLIILTTAVVDTTMLDT